MCDVILFLTFASLGLVLLWQPFYLFCSSIVINTVKWQPEPLSHNESGRFGALKSDSTHHFFRNACTKSGSLRFSQFSGCWLILSVYILEFWLSLCKIVRSSVILLYPYLQNNPWTSPPEELPVSHYHSRWRFCWVVGEVRLCWGILQGQKRCKVSMYRYIGRSVNHDDNHELL